MDNEKKIIKWQEVKTLKSAVIVKPIKAYAEVKEKKFVREISQSLLQKPSANTIQKNYECMDMLRKARRG